MVTFELSIDVTYKCPFSCLFCSSPRDILLPDMNLRTASKCLDFAHRIFKNGPITITVTGGEPLTLDTLPVLISAWAKDSTIIRLCTTGVIDVGKNYWQALKSTGLQSVFLSLHCISNKTRNNIFGEKYEFNIVNTNVERIMAAGINIYINFVLTKLNANSFDEVFDYCIKKGIKRIRVLGLAKQGEATKNWNKIATDTEIGKSFIEHASKMSHNSLVELEFAGLPQFKRCSHTDDKGQCLGGKNFFHINTNGDLYPCPSTKSIRSERIGSVFDFKGTLVFSRFPCEENRIL